MTEKQKHQTTLRKCRVWQVYDPTMNITATYPYDREQQALEHAERIGQAAQLVYEPTRKLQCRNDESPISEGQL